MRPLITDISLVEVIALAIRDASNLDAGRPLRLFKNCETFPQLQLLLLLQSKLQDLSTQNN
jgi:hypothetical protein